MNNKYLEKIAIDIDMAKGPDGVFKAAPPKAPGTALATVTKPTMSKIPKPGIFSRVASRVGRMSTIGKVGLGVAAGVAGTKALSNNRNN